MKSGLHGEQILGSRAAAIGERLGQPRRRQESETARRLGLRRSGTTLERFPPGWFPVDRDAPVEVVIAATSTSRRQSSRIALAPRVKSAPACAATPREKRHEAEHFLCVSRRHRPGRLEVEDRAGRPEGFPWRRGTAHPTSSRGVRRQTPEAARLASQTLMRRASRRLPPFSRRRRPWAGPLRCGRTSGRCRHPRPYRDARGASGPPVPCRAAGSGPRPRPERAPPRVQRG